MLEGLLGVLLRRRLRKVLEDLLGSEFGNLYEVYIIAPEARLPPSRPRINARRRKRQSIYYFKTLDNEELLVVLKYHVA